MSDLQTQSSYAVQPEIVLSDDSSIRSRVDNFAAEIHCAEGTRIDHETHPIQTRHILPSILRVCIGQASTASFSVQLDETHTSIVDQPTMEWTWRPDAQWQVGFHRHGIGFSTSRGLYVDEQSVMYLYMHFDNQWPVYGLGEKTGDLNKKNRRWSFWNSDVFLPHTESTDELYQSIPFFITKTDQGWLGVFLDNPGRTVLDFSLDQELCISVETGAIDLYLISGNSQAEILANYTRLTGKPFLPPKWALGYHQSRHSYQSESEVCAIVESFRAQNIPLDALYLDIMYMEDYRVFSFNPETFATAPEMIERLMAMGVRLVPIIDPGIKVDVNYRVYQQGLARQFFIQDQQFSPWQGEVWPGLSVWPDFLQSEVRDWWRDLHQFYIDMGVQGFWNDMNEPAVFNDQMTIDDDALHYIEGEYVEHKDVHNAYGLMMSEATANAVSVHAHQRPFVLTRSAYAGIQRVAAVWTGDNRSSWEHLRLSVPMLLNLGLSGVPFAGADIGGFMDDSRPELFTRWMQLGAFYPLMRNHCSIGQHAQEPWSFGEPWTSIAVKAIRRRYALIPYLYQLFRDANETGTPIMRPMMWNEEYFATTNNMADQFMFGDDILVAPIMEPSQLARAVWLPSGKWLNVQDGSLVEGGGYCLAHSGLEDIPLFLRAGNIIPLSPPRQSTDDELKYLRLLIVSGKESNRILFRDDDGISVDEQHNQYVRLSFGYQVSEHTIECHLVVDQSHYQPTWQTLEIGLPLAWKGRTININGTEYSGRGRADDVAYKVVFVSASDWL
jgi:alpha-glucosidase